MATNQTPNPTQLFAEFVAVLRGTPQHRALRVFDMDAPETHAAALLLKGDDRGRQWFAPERIDAALKFARGVGLLGP